MTKDLIHKSWDPLEASTEADQAIRATAQKRQIKNILKSYVGQYDSFSELIQNALDAVDKRYKEEGGSSNYEKKLWLTVDLKENSFSILDNGVGFNEAEFKSFLAPNISFKYGNDSRGNKGVGATYIAYGFQYIQFGTKASNKVFSGEMEHGREWVEDREGIETNPKVEATTINNKDFQEIDRGSFFKIKFGGNFTRPKDLSWPTATTAEQWSYLLLIKTPLGTIDYIDSNIIPVKFNIKVIDKSGSVTEIKDKLAKFVYPHNEIQASVNLKDVLKNQSSISSQGKYAGNVPSKFLKSNGIYEFFSTEDVKKLKNIDLDLVSEFDIEAYGYFSYSTSVWDQFNDKKAKLRKGYRVLKGGLQLANNMMIQGELIAIPLTSNIGYQNQCFILVHFKNADPDLGRKGFQPELKDLAEKISVNIVNKFKQWKHLLKSDSGASANIFKDKARHEWIKEQEQHEKSHPLVLENEHFFKPLNEISILSQPQSEQDVIVLFNQLIAGGVIRGIKLLATNQRTQYDGIFKFCVKEPLENHRFDNVTNPLGVIDSYCEEALITEPKVLEYKYNLDALIQEFSTEDKNPTDINLAIAWEMGSNWKQSFEATSLLNLDYIHQRQFHGVTHILDSKTTKFYVIILKELIDYLHDVDGVQSYHIEHYEDDIFN